MVCLPGRCWGHNDLLSRYQFLFYHNTQHEWQISKCCRRTARLHHDDVIKWKHYPRYWPFVRGIHRSPVNSLHKSQRHRAFMFSLICTWINGWVNNGEAGDLRRHRDHYDVTVMMCTTRYHPMWSGDLMVSQAESLATCVASTARSEHGLSH